MQVVQKYHTKGYRATVIQPVQPPGTYFFIQEEDKVYLYCYSNKEMAEQVMATLQTSWDRIDSERDRDLVVNFRDDSSDCVISTREPHLQVA